MSDCGGGDCGGGDCGGGDTGGGCDFSAPDCSSAPDASQDCSSAPDTSHHHSNAPDHSHTSHPTGDHHNFHNSISEHNTSDSHRHTGNSHDTSELLWMDPILQPTYDSPHEYSRENNLQSKAGSNNATTVQRKQNHYLKITLIALFTVITALLVCIGLSRKTRT